MKTTNQIFDGLKPLIVDQLGVGAEKVTLESSFQNDLGVCGDDGTELFEMLGKHYNVEWHGLNIGVLFGNEGLGPVPPWALKNNCVLYENQPCEVRDVVKAIKTGKWEATPMILKPKTERFIIYITSYLITGILIGVLSLGLFNI